MDRLRTLQYFVEAARARSFSGASRELAVSVPAVAKGVNALERDLGTVLFERTSRGLTLTASGAAYLESCLPALALLQEADTRARAARHEAAGTVVVGVHNVVARHALATALPRFHAQHPRIALDLRDFDNDERAEGIDVFLTMGWGTPPNLVQRKVASAHFWVLASPQYLARHGVPRHPNDLARHNCLLLRNTLGKVMDLWEFTRGDERAAVIAKGGQQHASRQLCRRAAGGRRRGPRHRLDVFRPRERWSAGAPGARLEQHRSAADQRSVSQQRGAHPAHPARSRVHRLRHRAAGQHRPAP